MKILLEVDGRRLDKSLQIIRYSPHYQPFDDEATGRTRAPGIKMIRETLATVVNFSVEIFETTDNNPEFVFLMERAYDLGIPSKPNFYKVRHVDMIGREWIQNMYFVIDALDCEYLNDDTVSRVANFEVRFIAEEGQTR